MSASAAPLLAALCPLAVGCVLCLSCARAPELAGRISALEAIVEQAQRNGAIRCAPRELATAQSQLRFATLELDQGFLSRARRHFDRAEPNARAALFLSPPQYCARRRIVEASPPALDTDTDGVFDDADQCLLEAEDRDQYLDGDGCPEADNDVDTLLDVADQCPLSAEDPDGHDDQDGCPEPDNDGDTVLDALDACPNEPGSVTDAPPGCPATPPLAIVTDCEVKLTQRIEFELNSDRLRAGSHVVLNAVAAVLAKNPAIHLEIQGHTDDRGAAQRDRLLSDGRAASVKKYLVAQGVTPERLTSRGYGSDRPLVGNTTEQNRAFNRRVQFVRTEGMKEGCSATGTQ
jgi:outer membrane protein OmpA-like peptidoglycan-associated protein